jgi:cysteine-rich repeat protein
VCGNGKVEADEQCDDGNTVSGDGCELCRLVAIPPSFSLDVRAERKIFSGVSNEIVSFYLTVRNNGAQAISGITEISVACSPTTEYPTGYRATSGIRQSINPGSAADGVLGGYILAPTVTLRTSCLFTAKPEGQAANTLLKNFTVLPFGVCGDGKIEGSEQCDDTNTVSGDGCSSSCQLEATTTDMSVLNSWPPSVNAGNSIAYQIQIANRGSITAKSVRIFHLIDSRLQFTQLPSNCSKDGSEQAILCVMGDIQNNTSGTITVAVRIPNDPALCAASLSVISEVSAATLDSSLANNESESIATVQCPTN